MNEVRQKMLQEIMGRHQLAGLIFWRPDELVLLLGYMPLWGLSFLVYTADDEAVLFVPELEPEDLWPEGVTVETFPWGDMDCADPWSVLYGKMQSLLKQAAVTHMPVSFIRSAGRTAPCMMSGEQPPLPEDLIGRLETLHEGGYLDASADLLRLYAYKTADDAAALRLTHRIAAKAVHAFYGLMEAGLTESDVANGIETAVQRMTGTPDIRFAKAWPMVQSGVNASFGGRFNRTSGKQLASGEMVMVEMGICVNGFWADITRTGLVGWCSDKLLRVYDTVLEAQEDAMSIMRPGVAMAEVDAVSRACISRSGWGHLYRHGLGHHVGFRYHDPGDTLSPGSPGILEAGMVLTVEPGIYGAEIGGGVRIEENVLITRDGYELLSDYPKGLMQRL